MVGVLKTGHDSSPAEVMAVTEQAGTD